ncbi:MAG TPA: VOC family protein [Myxococcota bacterium]|nr:VOC family protein [Myxococcota bacterium]
MRKPLIWFEVAGQHSDNLKDFYAEVLGWQSDVKRTPPDRVAGAAAPRRGFFRRSAQVPSAPPWWVTFYTEVSDLDSAIRAARAHGSRVLVPPTRHGDTSFAVVSDPEGHPVGLCS